MDILGKVLIIFLMIQSKIESSMGLGQEKILSFLGFSSKKIMRAGGRLFLYIYIFWVGGVARP